MCGINLIIDKSHKVDNSIIQKMASMTHYRGPDETRVILETSGRFSCHMAANRLMITDQTEFASQPFSIGTSQKYLLFNGEVYNYRNLKNKLLDKGIHFHSNSDTEVLFHWLNIYGRDGVADLEGMFAFAFLDFEQEKIFIARDASGIKTIYYYDNEEIFLASSELKPIVESGLCEKRFNSAQINYYLLYKFASPPETFFKDVYELEPGAILHFENFHWKKSKFSSWNTPQSNESIDICTIEELITDSLMDQLEQKVPTGLLLSGGVDSSLLLALASKSGYRMPTFSVVYSEHDKSSDMNDSKYSRIAANLYNSDHHELAIDKKILNGFGEFIDLVDQPIGDSSYLLTSEICKYASGSMKVLLSGAGADELFGGYNRHWAFYQYLEHKKLLDIIVPALQSVSKVLPSGIPFSRNKKLEYFQKVINAYSRSPERTWMNFIAFTDFSPEVMPVSNSGISVPWLDWALWHDRTHYLVGDILALTDKASMLHGVEVRVPYLNEKLIAYLNSSSAKVIMNHGRKRILRKILIENGGGQIANRSKEGFGLPLGNWLNDKKYWHILDPLQYRASRIYEMVDKLSVDRILKQHQAGRKDNGPLIWSLLVLAHWLERNF